MGTNPLWRWLACCRRCNEPHEWQSIGAGGSWESRVDGHAYDPRLQPDHIAQLRAEYEEQG